MKKTIFLAIIILFAACESSKNSASVTFKVNEGDSIARITSRLINQGIITQRLPFRLYAKLTGKESKLKTGTYAIPHAASYGEILDILVSGIGQGILVTIPEGFNIFQIAYTLDDKNIVNAKDFLNEVYKNEWLQKFNLPTNTNYNISSTKLILDKNNFHFIVPNNPPQYSLEGYLFPDTYAFEENCSARNVVRIMTDHFNKVLSKEILDEIKTQNKNIHDVITLASIVQKESVNSDEMPKVSGVYNNRLRRNMILQADPTLIYALIIDGEYDGNIRNRHLRPPWPSDYNTYYIKTLPRGPIANPGEDAILAALAPSTHNYLYFVANSKGGHTYSPTLTEHNKAVADWVKYIRGR